MTRSPGLLGAAVMVAVVAVATACATPYAGWWTPFLAGLAIGGGTLLRSPDLQRAGRDAARRTAAGVGAGWAALLAWQLSGPRASTLARVLGRLANAPADGGWPVTLALAACTIALGAAAAWCWVTLVVSAGTLVRREPGRSADTRPVGITFPDRPEPAPGGVPVRSPAAPTP